MASTNPPTTGNHDNHDSNDYYCSLPDTTSTTCTDSTSDDPSHLHSSPPSHSDNENDMINDTAMFHTLDDLHSIFQAASSTVVDCTASSSLMSSTACDSIFHVCSSSSTTSATSSSSSTPSSSNNNNNTSTSSSSSTASVNSDHCILRTGSTLDMSPNKLSTSASAAPDASCTTASTFSASSATHYFPTHPLLESLCTCSSNSSNDHNHNHNSFSNIPVSDNDTIVMSGFKGRAMGFGLPALLTTSSGNDSIQSRHRLQPQHFLTDLYASSSYESYPDPYTNAFTYTNLFTGPSFMEQQRRLSTDSSNTYSSNSPLLSPFTSSSTSSNGCLHAAGGFWMGSGSGGNSNGNGVGHGNGNGNDGGGSSSGSSSTSVADISSVEIGGGHHEHHHLLLHRDSSTLTTTTHNTNTSTSNVHDHHQHPRHTVSAIPPGLHTLGISSPPSTPVSTISPLSMLARAVQDPRVIGVEGGQYGSGGEGSIDTARILAEFWGVSERVCGGTDKDNDQGVEMRAGHVVEEEEEDDDNGHDHDEDNDGMTKSDDTLQTTTSSSSTTTPTPTTLATSHNTFIRSTAPSFHHGEGRIDPPPPAPPPSQQQQQQQQQKW